MRKVKSGSILDVCPTTYNNKIRRESIKDHHYGKVHEIENFRRDGKLSSKIQLWRGIQKVEVCVSKGCSICKKIGIIYITLQITYGVLCSHTPRFWNTFIC